MVIRLAARQTQNSSPACKEAIPFAETTKAITQVHRNYPN